jgi:UDP-glucose 4-epimerase
LGATPVPEDAGTPERHETPVTLVVGASGLLGSAVSRAVGLRGGTLFTAQIPWHEPGATVEALLAATAELPADGWRLVWCAGAGVVATSPEHFERELWVLDTFLGRWLPERGSDQAVFLASSAGGVYAGSAAPPFNEHTVPVPISPYGHAKLRAEAIFSAFSERTGVPVMLGRLSNLYGPGQDLGKGQGLVSLLCRAHLTGKPLDVFVSLDTIRDYLFADDAAAMALAGADAVAVAGGTHVKLVASGQSLTISSVIGEVRRITRRRPPIVTRTSAVTKYQTSDLRMRSVAWPPLQGLAHTPFSVGVAACLTGVEASLRCPREGTR